MVAKTEEIIALAIVTPIIIGAICAVIYSTWIFVRDSENMLWDITFGITYLMIFVLAGIGLARSA